MDCGGGSGGSAAAGRPAGLPTHFTGDFCRQHDAADYGGGDGGADFALGAAGRAGWRAAAAQFILRGQPGRTRAAAARAILPFCCSRGGGDGRDRNPCKGWPAPGSWRAASGRVSLASSARHPAGMDSCHLDSATLRETLGVQVEQLPLAPIFAQMRKPFPPRRRRRCAKNWPRGCRILRSYRRRRCTGHWRRIRSSPQSCGNGNLTVWRCAAGRNFSRRWGVRRAGRFPCSTTSCSRRRARRT
jgi:hypothetical protein